MPSPQGLFLSFTNEQLLTLQEEGYNGALYGQFISTSGGGKGGTKQRLSMSEFLLELNYALRKAGILAPRAQKVTQIIAYPPLPSEPVDP